MTTYNFQDTVRNDTFKSVQFTMQDAAGDPIVLTNVHIKMQFRSGNANGQLIKEMTEIDGLTITDGANGIFETDAFTCTWPVGTYYYDAQFTFSGGDIETYFGGYKKIVQDTTK